MKLPAFIVTAAMLQATPSFAQDAGIFDKLSSTNVDMLTFGIQALQTDLNIGAMHLCSKGCLARKIHFG